MFFEKYERTKLFYIVLEPVFPVSPTKHFDPTSRSSEIKSCHLEFHSNLIELEGMSF